MGNSRKHPRFPVNFGSTFSGEQFASQGTITNLSLGGCSIESKVTLTNKSNLVLQIPLPNSQAPLQIDRAVVRWVRGNSFGVEFEQIPQADMDRLHQLIQDLEQGRPVIVQPTRARTRTQTKILVVDDSPDFQMLVKTFVAEENYVVISAGDTLQATGEAIRNKPSVIVLDVGLPGGDGWMLLDRLKANALTRTIPILVVTGQTKQGLNEKAKSKGAVGFLNKPIEKEALLAALREALTPPSTPNKPA